MSTSSISPGSIPARWIACFTTCPPIVAPWVMLSAPRHDLARPVRAVETMSASVIFLSGSGTAHRRGMARKLERLAGVGDHRPVHLEDRNVVVHVVADVEILAVGAEDDSFGQAAHFHLADFGDLLAVDLQHRHRAVAVVEERRLVAVAAAKEDRHRDLARRADGEPLRPVADYDLVDHARRRCLQVDDADRVY